MMYPTSLRHQMPGVLRAVVLLLCGAAMSATLAIAGDPSAATAPPPPQFAPLTKSERFTRYLRSLVDTEALLRSASSAGISQATGTPGEWGGGAAGFGDRVGNAYAYHVIHRTLQYGISAPLHEDNRYFVSGQTGFMRRTRYAIKSTFLARHDNGDQSFSFSRIGSAAGAAFISRAWQPPSTTSAGDGAVSFGITMGSDIGFNVFREFWPDIQRRIRKR